jgi:hypothetical protein
MSKTMKSRDEKILADRDRRKYNKYSFDVKMGFKARNSKRK